MARGRSLPVVIAAALLVAACLPGEAAEPPTGGPLIPAERLTVWAPGIPGGVPVRTAICARVSAETYGDGARDASAGIQAALDGCPDGEVVRLGPGTFRIAQALELRSGVVLRGEGPARTRLAMPVGTKDVVIVAGTRWLTFVQSTDLAADAVKGRSSVALTHVPAGLAPGELVAIDERTDPGLVRWSAASPPGDPSRAWFTRPDRPIGQVLEVASVDGDTVTFTTPFHITMRTALAAQLSRFSSSNAVEGAVVRSVRHAGIEDLSVRGGGGGQGNILLSNTAYSWVRNVESAEQDGASVALEATFRSVLRDSYIHTARAAVPGGGAYGVSLSHYAADNLVENNIVWDENKVMVMRATGGGNVIGYNYMEDGWIAYDPGWVETGLNASHMTTPHYELFEGNESFNFDGDNTWGNSIYITVFRNHLTGRRRSAPPLVLHDLHNARAVGLMSGHWWYSFVGNVLGSPGSRGVTTWELGYDPASWLAPPDERVVATALREGNYDYETDAVRWSAGARALPASLYLTGRPAFFGDAVWPWVEPTSARKTYVLPARSRFDALVTR